MTTYQLRVTNGTTDSYVATVTIGRESACTFTTRHGYRRMCLWDSIEELATWACDVHGIDPYVGFLMDESTGEIYLPE